MSNEYEKIGLIIAALAFITLLSSLVFIGAGVYEVIGVLLTYTAFGIWLIKGDKE